MSVEAPARPVPEQAPARGIAGAAPLPWLLPIRPLQAALWEIAGIAILLALTVDGIPQAVWISIVAVAGVLVLTTSVRFAGRHAAGWALTWARYRLKRRDKNEVPDPLHRLAGPVRVRQHVDRAGNRFGVAEVSDGWSAIVRLTPGTVAPSPDKLVGILREAYTSTGIPLSSAQLLTWTVPNGQSLLRVRWLTVRYRPEDAPIAALARGGGELGALRSTACAALRLMGTLAEAGFESTVLEAGEVTENLRVALGSGQDTPVDGWRSWAWGGASQVCYRPRSERDLGRTLDFHVPGSAFTATSYTLYRSPGGREKSEVTIRVGGRPGAEPVRPAGIAVAPLHGRHAAAVRRTLPLALEN
ncbi:type VII secretion protein EccE [Amycolatopsis roodepoortensis]|uniref:type VII secretion protein EccE n=1 Tax=Amycolatopsis roodepoortensis TaxID=700274 RepID=UPI00214BBBEE|nr:type VII secretion protein EccE [Amycolatopsis roodepoortensis]UUV30564.1 type VII secretion protein EccE [Amycolatopsis roodepoortensis]